MAAKKSQLEYVTELHEYLYRITVGQTVNYGAFHGFFKPFPELGQQINQTSSKLVGACKNGASKLVVSDLVSELEGQILVAQSTETLAAPDAEKALGLLDLVKGDT